MSRTDFEQRKYQRNRRIKLVTEFLLTYVALFAFVMALFGMV